MVTASAESYAEGFDPAYDNPFDPEQRYFNYTRIWYILLGSGIDLQDTLWIGALLVFGFFISLATLRGEFEPFTAMIMIRSIVRPEKVDNVLAALMEAGFPGVTKMSVVGRGKQRGIKIGEITYDEIPKVMLMSVINTADKDFVIDTIMETARSSGKGAFGDGKIFVTEVEESYTISSGAKETAYATEGVQS